MSTKAKVAPWVSVDALTPGVADCDHRWVTVRVGDVVRSCYDPDEQMVFCARCYAPRCGHTSDPNPCMEPRHHRTFHRYANGAREKVGA